MPTPLYENYISQITLPNGNTYHIKDAEARQWINDMIAAGLSFKLAWDGSSEPVVAEIPAGVKVRYNDTEYTGTLVANATTKPYIYLVYSDRASTPARDVYEEYVTVDTSKTSTPSYAWEALGNTDISLDVLGNLAWKDSVTLNKGNGDMVLGESTTFTAADSAVSFSGGTADTFVKSYPGTTSKMATTTVTGTGDNISFDAVKTNTSKTATKVVFGTDVSATKITEGTAAVANKTTLGTALTASKATAGDAVSVAKVASSATNISYIGNNDTSSVLESATVSEETLILGSVSVSQGSVTGTNGTQSITPYTFTNVSVPVVSVSADVSVPQFTSEDVTVPVITSHEDVTASLIETESKTAATKASSATTVATGALAANGAGASVMTGLGTAVTADAVTNIGTGTAAAQSITVGTNDKVNVAKYGDLSVSVS